jgi:hypothetical protein
MSTKHTKRLYIVLDDNGTPLSLGGCNKDTPAAGVLLADGPISLLTYSSARRAIQRSRRYADSKGFRWGLSNCRIVSVTTTRPKLRRSKP